MSCPLPPPLDPLPLEEAPAPVDPPPPLAATAPPPPPPLGDAPPDPALLVEDAPLATAWAAAGAAARQTTAIPPNVKNDHAGSLRFMADLNSGHQATRLPG